MVCGEAGACVECRDENDCAGGICNAETSTCLRCNPSGDDGQCQGGAFCDWIDGRCRWALPNQPICGNCGLDEQCGEGNLCVRHSSAQGNPLERFCGTACQDHQDCPRGYACGRVGDRGFACMPDGLEYGLTCAAVRDLGDACNDHAQCGVGDEGRCHANRCTYGCEEQGAARRFCPEDFACLAAPRDVHPWGQVCQVP